MTKREEAGGRRQGLWTGLCHTLAASTRGETRASLAPSSHTDQLVPRPSLGLRTHRWASSLALRSMQSSSDVCKSNRGWMSARMGIAKGKDTECHSERVPGGLPGAVAAQVRPEAEGREPSEKHIPAGAKARRQEAPGLCSE